MKKLIIILFAVISSSLVANAQAYNGWWEVQENETLTYPYYTGNGGIGYAANTYYASVDISYPASVNNGDICFLQLAYTGSNSHPNISGWTYLGGQQTSNRSAYLYYRICNGSEGGNTITVSKSVSYTAAGLITSFTGGNGVVYNSTGSFAFSSSVNIGGGDVDYAGSLLLGFVSLPSPNSGFSFPSATNYTRIVNQNRSATVRYSFGAYSKNVPSPGTISAETITLPFNVYRIEFSVTITP